jgi:glyoxalase family protein
MSESRTTPTPAPLSGFHHVTAGTRDMRRCLAFYTETLRLRCVKRTVNFDEPTLHHLYFGDQTGAPGTLLTAFEWPRAVRGRTGIGGVEHIAFAVESGAALAYWRGHLERTGVDVGEPLVAHGRPTLRFTDPDGLRLELCAPAGEDVPDGAPALWSASWAVRGLDHVLLHASERAPTTRYYRDLLGLELVSEAVNHDDPSQPEFAFDLGHDAQLRVALTTREALPHARHGAGQTHHIALTVADGASQLAWQERLASAGVNVTDVLDRRYFQSIYFRDPDGLLLELATSEPGFTLDEPLDALGTALQLPPWFAPRRAELEAALTPLDGPADG